jgi:hypothetical protein
MEGVMSADKELLAIKRVSAVGTELPQDEAGLRALRLACTALLGLDEGQRERVRQYVRMRREG